MFYATFGVLLALAGLVTVLIMKQNKKNGSGKAKASTGSTATPAVKAEDISAVDFEVLRTNSTTPFIVMFHRSGCGACDAQKPIFDRVAPELAGKVKFIKISTDIEGNRPLARRMGVTRIPMHFVFKPGSTEPVASHLGLMDDEKLKSWVETSIK